MPSVANTKPRQDGENVVHSGQEGQSAIANCCIVPLLHHCIVTEYFTPGLNILFTKSRMPVVGHVPFEMIFKCIGKVSLNEIEKLN